MSPFRDSPRTGPQCGCGHGRDHPMVSASGDYSFIGWFFILLGVSWDPSAISFVCRSCDAIIERIDDPLEMRAIRIDG